MSDEQMKPKVGIVDAASDDPFDLAKLRLPQDFLAESPRQAAADNGASPQAGATRFRAGASERGLPPPNGAAQT